MVVLLSISAQCAAQHLGAETGGDMNAWTGAVAGATPGRGDATSTRLCRPTSGTRLSNLHPAQGGAKIFLKVDLNIFQDVLNI